MALIWVLSSMNLSGTVIDAFPMRDKGLHFVEYAILGVLVAHAAMRTWPTHSRWRTAILGVVIGLAWGLIDELHQAFVPGRDGNAWDLVADGLGSAVGASLRLAIHAIRVQLDEEKP